MTKHSTIHHLIGGFMLFASLIGVITALVGFTQNNFKASLFMLVIYILMTVCFYLEFIHGTNLKHQARKKIMQANQLQRMIEREQLPVFYYNNGSSLVHTHFTFTTPYLTEVELNNNILKIKCDRPFLKNKETIVDLNNVTNINFREITLKPGYLNFVINGQIEDYITVSPNTILFAGDSKQYVYELKNYIEYVLGQRNTAYYN